jgi:alpha-D-ribose 1-methylphosphonate 5-triphosphate diphosphatase
MSVASVLQTGALPRPLPLPPVRFTGAEVLRDGALRCRSLAVEAGRIGRGPLPEIDMSGFVLLPGIVDLRCDALEPWAAAEPATALARAGQAAAAAGITTGWLSQGWSWEGGHHGPDRAERLLTAHSAWRDTAPGDLRIRLRAETHLTDAADRLLAAVRRHGVDLVVFSDRTRAAAVESATFPEARRRAEAALARRGQVPRHLCRLAEAFDTMGVAYGSQGDPDGETRERFSMIGAGLADAPASRAAAAAAKAMNEPVVLPAPDLLREPRPGPGAALLAQGLCDALASGGDVAAPAAAAFALVDRGLADLATAWALVSTRPAEIMGLADRGTLDRGRRADFVAIDRESRQVEMTVARGHLTYLGRTAATRLGPALAAYGLAAE